MAWPTAAPWRPLPTTPGVISCSSRRRPACAGPGCRFSLGLLLPFTCYCWAWSGYCHPCPRPPPRLRWPLLRARVPPPLLRHKPPQPSSQPNPFPRRGAHPKASHPVRSRGQPPPQPKRRSPRNQTHLYSKRREGTYKARTSRRMSHAPVKRTKTCKAANSLHPVQPGKIPRSLGRPPPIRQDGRRPISRVKRSRPNLDRRGLDKPSPRPRNQPSPARRGSRPRTNLGKRSHPNLGKHSHLNLGRHSHPNLDRHSQGRASLRGIIRPRARPAAARAAAPRDRPCKPAHPRIRPRVRSAPPVRRRWDEEKIGREGRLHCPAPGPRVSPRRTCSARLKSTSSPSPCPRRCAISFVATLSYPHRSPGPPAPPDRRLEGYAHFGSIVHFDKPKRYYRKAFLLPSVGLNPSPLTASYSEGFKRKRYQAVFRRPR